MENTDLTQYWLEILPQYPHIEQDLHQTLKACYKIHLWTLAKLQVIPNLRRSSDLGQLLTMEMNAHRQTIYKDIPRFPLERTIEKTIKYWYSLEDWEDVPPLPEEEFHSFKLPPRKIWKRYVQSFNRLSTVYGMFFLEGNWEEVLEEQASDIGIKKEFIPAICHSIEIRWTNPGWELSFLLHPPRSSLANRKIDRTRYRRKQLQI